MTWTNFFKKSCLLVEGGSGVAVGQAALKIDDNAEASVEVREEMCIIRLLGMGTVG